MGNSTDGHRRPARTLVVAVSAGFVALALLLGLLAIRRSIRRTQDERFFREIMLVQEALEQYSNQSSRGEPSYAVLRRSDPKNELAKTPIDGKWRINLVNKGKNRESAEIIVDHPDRTLKQMEELDAAIDDGNLATGNFRIIAPDTYALRVLDSDPDGGRISAGESSAESKR
jgi:hypothetical protein